MFINQRINSLEIFNYPRKILGPSRQDRALDARKIIPIEAIKPWVSHHLSKTILKLRATIRSTTNSSFGASKQAGEKVDALCREFSPNLSRNLMHRKDDMVRMLTTTSKAGFVRPQILPQVFDAISESFGKSLQDHRHKRECTLLDTRT